VAVYWRNMKYLYVLIITLLCLSCGTHRKGTEVNGIRYKLNDNITLYLPADASDQEVSLIVDAAKVHTERFEFDWGEVVRPVRVSVIDKDLIECGDLDGDYIGCHYSPNGPIHVTIGTYLEIPALYHEYVHHMITGNDQKHTDPRWQSFWEPARATIIAGLRAERLNLEIK